MNKIIKDFGDEWEKFNQINISNNQNKIIFDDYFKIFPFNKINKSSIGADFGSGSGRWSKILCDIVKEMYLIEPSYKAINSSKNNLKKFNNVKFLNSTIQNTKFKENYFDFAISLGVLHHTLDIEKNLQIINRSLKNKSPFLIYLYYNLEDKSFLYKIIWRFSDLIRKLISKFPTKFKLIVCDLISIFIYLPMKYITKIFYKIRLPYKWLPLSYYHDKDFYILRNDSLDRFGTSYEKRYSKKDILYLLKNAGFSNVTFSDSAPFYCALSYKEK